MRFRDFGRAPSDFWLKPLQMRTDIAELLLGKLGEPPPHHRLGERLGAALAQVEHQSQRRLTAVRLGDDGRD